MKSPPGHEKGAAPLVHDRFACNDRPVPDDPRVVESALGGSDARLLGVGTFGETWSVRGVTPDADVCAVKIMKPETFHPRLLQREIEGLTRFSHPGIVRLHGARPVTIGSQVRAALLCEYVPGGSVDDQIKRGKMPSVEEVRAFACGLLDAVHALHAAETVHRDIKPANILLRDGQWAQPVLIDFGLARTLTEKTYTMYPAKVGSLLWMSPEQLTGQRARKAADVWACGVVLYQLMTGEHPFVDLRDLSGMDAEDLLDRVSAGGISLPDGSDVEVSKLVERLLTPSPQNARGSASRALRELKGTI